MKTRLLSLFFAISTASTFAELRLPAVISDHMVLQAGQSVPIWGWAEEGEAQLQAARDLIHDRRREGQMDGEAGCHEGFC